MIKGTIVFIKANEESKSAGTYPYLALENGEKVKIVLQNSNPFENNELSAYENKAVLVEGEYIFFFIVFFFVFSSFLSCRIDTMFFSFFI